MKKIFIFVILLFSLVSCGEITTTTTSTTTNFDSTTSTSTGSDFSYIDNSGYAKDIVIKEYMMPSELQQVQKYFLAFFSYVDYTPLTKSLTVTVNVSDADYHGAKYYLVGRYQGDASEERKHFVFGSSSGSLKYTFDNVNLSRTYEVLVAKTDTDDLNPSMTIFSVCTLEISDPFYDNRSAVSLLTSNDNSPEYLAYDETPYIDLHIEYSDEDQSITQLALGLYSSYDKTLIEERYVEINSSNWAQGIITLDSILYEDLSPFQEYLVQVYATGNDGVDSFELAILGTYSIAAPTYENSYIEDSFYNLYATITHSEIVGDNAVFYYTALNTGSYVYSDTLEPVTIMVYASAGNINYVSYESEYNEVFALDLESGSFTIPLEYAKNGAYIRLYDQRNKYEFCLYVVNPGIVCFNSFISIYQDLRFEIPDDSNMNLVTNVDVRIYNASHQLVNEYLDLDLSQSSFAWSLPTGVGSYIGWEVVVEYETDTLIGLITHQQTILLN